MPAPLGSPIFVWFDTTGAPAVGYRVYTYVATTATPLATYPTSADASAGTSPLSNPVILDAAGSAQIWLADALYKVVIKTDLDVLVQTIDNINGATGGGGTTTISQWIAFSGTPTYVSATSFVVPGDQTASFTIGRRVKSSVTAGTAFSQVSAAVFGGGNTTVTVVNTSGVLDGGLSQISLGIVTPDNTSLPAWSDVTVNGSLIFLGPSGTSGAILPFTSPLNDQLSEIMTSGPSNGRFTAKVAGTYLLEGTVTIQEFVGTTGMSGQSLLIDLFKNAVTPYEIGRISWPYADSLARQLYVPIGGSMTLAVGDYIEIWPTAIYTDASGPKMGVGTLSIRRIA
jgi:hypothetical protein